MSRRRDLNPRPADYESAAPPTKLRRHIGFEYYCILKKCLSFIPQHLFTYYKYPIADDLWC